MPHFACFAVGPIPKAQARQGGRLSPPATNAKNGSSHTHTVQGPDLRNLKPMCTYSPNSASFALALEILSAGIPEAWAFVNSDVTQAFSSAVMNITCSPKRSPKDS
mmetsp:Transcript_37124/g.66202  ORF Transcript_37124/g.66202 Transcript_37124/m.66202 type:complete len:106 (-) Transcript_37124:1546-1863(-)